MTRTTTEFARRLGLHEEAIRWGALLVLAEVLVLLAYYSLANARLTAVRFVVYPLVWINVAGWAIARVELPESTPRRRRLGGAVAVGYFVVLAYFGGLWALGTPPMAPYLTVSWLPPGWGPAVLFADFGVVMALMPYKLVGYAALAYLVYAVLLETAGSAMRGVVGLFSCVSCTWPILATVLSGLFGAGSAVASVATNQPYGVSTLVFVSAVALLVWRPLW
jgi:hypothetical protein